MSDNGDLSGAFVGAPYDPTAVLRDVARPYSEPLSWDFFPELDQEERRAKARFARKLGPWTRASAPSSASPEVRRRFEAWDYRLGSLIATDQEVLTDNVAHVLDAHGVARGHAAFVAEAKAVMEGLRKLNLVPSYECARQPMALSTAGGDRLICADGSLWARVGQAWSRLPDPPPAPRWPDVGKPTKVPDWGNMLLAPARRHGLNVEDVARLVINMADAAMKPVVTLYKEEWIAVPPGCTLDDVVRKMLGVG